MSFSRDFEAMPEKDLEKKNKSLLYAALAMLAVLALICAGFVFTVLPRLRAEHCYGVLAFYVGMLVILTVGGICLVQKMFGRSSFSVSTEQVAWIMAVFWGMVYMLVFPPMSAPDESVHFAQSYYYSNVLLGKAEWNTEVEGDMYPGMRADDITNILYTRPGLDDMNQMLHALLKPLSDGGMQSQHRAEALGGVVWSYLPQTLGITLARLLGLGSMPLMFLARLLNFAMYLCFFYLALKWIPFGKQALAVIGLFPMTLHLVSSMNYDALVLGLSFLFVAKVLQLVYEKEKVTVKDMAVLTVIMALLAPVKVIYVLLAFLCFIIPPEKFGGRKRYWCSALVMAGVVAVFFLAVNIPRVLPYLQETNLELDYTEQATEGYTLKELLSSPLKVAAITVNTIRHYGSEHLVRMVGKELGWLEIPVPLMVIIGFLGVLVLAAVMEEREIPEDLQHPKRLIGKARGWSIFVIAGVIFLAIFSMLAAWTPAGSPVAEGVQGRYYLPVLPLAVLLIRSPNLVKKKDYSRWIWFSVYLMHMWAVASAFEYIVSRLGYDVVGGMVVR